MLFIVYLLCLIFCLPVRGSLFALYWLLCLDSFFGLCENSVCQWDEEGKIIKKKASSYEGNNEANEWSCQTGLSRLLANKQSFSFHLVCFISDCIECSPTIHRNSGSVPLFPCVCSLFRNDKWNIAGLRGGKRRRVSKKNLCVWHRNVENRIETFFMAQLTSTMFIRVKRWI